MKRYILAAICCIATLVSYAQYPDCTQIDDFSPTISRWGAAYQPVPNELECWTIDLGVQGHAKITYNIDLELVNGLDQILIYELNDNNQTTRLLRSFFACTTSGTLITNSTTGKVKIEYWGYSGNCGGLYNGFQIRVETATCCDLVNHDHYIMGKLGVGTTTPQEMLHVNGAIRGGGSYGALQLKTQTGNLEFGPMDGGHVRFKTNMGSYYFDKKLIIENGILSSSSSALTFNTNYSTPCMTILNGNVGIGTTNPSCKLDVAGVVHANAVVVNTALRANEIIVSTTGADFVFAEDYQLRPLSEVKTFITENKHLPEIKSAQEMQENGVSVSELQTQLLQKIEELTLYLIQQEQTIQELRQEVEQLRKEGYE